MKNRKGFNLIELMVVIAIIAILASVALPMYSQFKRRTKAATAVKAISQAAQAIQAWHEDTQSFSGMALLSDGRTLQVGSFRVGASIGAVDNVTYTLGTTEVNRVIFSWTFAAGAGCDDCSGSFCISCNDDFCDTSVDLTENGYKLDKNSSTAGTNVCL